MDRNKKIILIDDETGFTKNVQSYFEMHGYKCLISSNGQEGLAKIEKEQPALMILDILMPNMDGYTMLRELKRRKINIKCIIITAKGRLKDLFELERVDRFLTKPFDLQRLKKIVDEMLGEPAGETTSISDEASDEFVEDPGHDDGKKRILVIEDEKRLAESLKQYLEMKGYVVSTVYSGAEGLQILETMVPDLIISDVMMPTMDGYSMIKEFRKKKKKVPIIVISGKEKIRDLVIMEGVDAFVAKPFEFDELEKKIEEIL